jgi:hypothetical protein
MELPGERPVLSFAVVFGLDPDAQVWGPGGLLIEPLSRLLDSDVPLLASPAMVGFPEGEYWTGIPVAVSDPFETCNGWTSVEPVSQGGVGDPMFTDLRWVGSRIADCIEPARLLCACW